METFCRYDSVFRIGEFEYSIRILQGANGVVEQN